MKKKKTISFKILLYFSLCFFILLCFYLIATVAAMRNALTEQQMNNLTNILYTNSNYLNLYSKEINTSLINISEILGLIEEEAQLMEILASFKEEHSEQILNIIHVTDKDNIFADRTHLLEIVNKGIYIELYEQSQNSSYKGIAVSSPYYSPLSLEKTVALYKPNEKTKATTIIELNLKYILNSIYTKESDYHFYLFAHESNIIASYNENPEIIETLLKKQDFKETQEISIKGNKFIIMEQANAIYNWDFIILFPEFIIDRAIRPLIIEVSIIGVLIMLILIIIMIFIQNYFTKPIANLANKIKNAKDLEEISFQSEIKRSDEIRVLALSLISMKEKINNLIKIQEKNADEKRLLEIKILQAQIHPHFLGNTLACIASLVKNDEKEQGYNSIILLIKLLNYSISNTNQLIPLKDEIEATQNYIKLRLMRSPNLFSYDFTILNKHLNHLVPKLIIQPIVENAISHGFQKDSKDNHLSITSYEHNGNLFISIYNSGIPISEKAIKEITSFKSNKASHGIGIKNVFRRLQLHEYRSKGGKIFKEKNGTIISLDLGDINQNTTRN